MNILTFDIEEWFHILDNNSTKTEKDWVKYEDRLNSNMNRILELLDAKNQKATFFCLGWVARKYPEIIRTISSNGYEVATHSDLHQLAYEQKRNVYAEDLSKSIYSLEDITGKKVTTYRAPGFSIKEENKWVFEELIKQGIEVDCSIFPAKRSHGGFESYGYTEPSIIEINGEQIKEFPINLYRMLGKNIIFSGGGYFRLLPYWMIKHMMNKSDYVMTYFHPRDFDPNQPMIDELSLFRKFKSYYGLSSSFTKLDKLISEFIFIDIENAVENINWDLQRRIHI
jgi:polysaccharide deacetylase family protein (PEP-CTERM system associated)